MPELKKYTSFEALKLNEKSDNIDQPKDDAFSAFETFLKILQGEYSNEKKIRTDNGKQPNR